MDPDPKLWFCQLKAVFSRCGVRNSLTKFRTVIPQLEFDVLQQVSDIVKHPSDTPYEDLKTRLIRIYNKSDHKRIQQLFIGYVSLRLHRFKNLLTFISMGVRKMTSHLSHGIKRAQLHLNKVKLAYKTLHVSTSETGSRTLIGLWCFESQYGSCASTKRFRELNSIEIFS